MTTSKCERNWRK